MKHCMVDIETLGEECIATIGAVSFDPYTVDLVYEDRFYKQIDVASAGQGRPDADTVRWWLEQSDAARREIIKAQSTLEWALTCLNAFYIEQKCSVMWSHVTYDETILRGRYKALGIAPAWHHKDAADLRTLARTLFPEAAAAAYKNAPFEKTHLAIDDAALQAHVVQLIYSTCLPIPAGAFDK